ncbi:MAG: hypothetical protein ACREEM_19485 [Blastocatellia bacterium]
MAEEQKPQGWWQTLPGILTAIAAIITAVTGLIAVLYKTGVFDGKTLPNVGNPMEIAGKWSGQAKDPSGTTFQVEVDIYSSCKLNEKCGTISVSHVPCYGEIFLKEAGGGDYEFHVDNFDNRSDLKTCQPGAGEHFKLLADGKLSYVATYSGATAVLGRVDK